MTNKPNFIEFTHKYSLSKTLRFELRPIGNDGKVITEAMSLRDYKIHALSEIVNHDEQLAEKAKIAKQILNDCHSRLLNNALPKFSIKDDDLIEAYENYCKSYKDKDKKDEKEQFDKQVEIWRKALSAHLKVQPEYKKLMSKEVFSLEAGNHHIFHFVSDEAKREIMQSFKGFTTYFTGFNQNRENLYVSEEESTAVGYRIFNENLPIYFKNCHNWQIIQDQANIDEETKQKLNHIVSQTDNILTPKGYKDFLWQEGIDEHNEKIGEINSEINQFNQKYKSQKDIKKLPFLNTLYKQILSTTEEINQTPIESERELYEELNQHYPAIVEKSDELINLIKTLPQRDLNTIYISHRHFTKISQKVYSDWAFIIDALKYKKINTKKTISIEDLALAIDEFIDYSDETEIKEYSGKDIINYFQSSEIDTENDNKENIFELLDKQQQQAKSVLTEDIENFLPKQKANSKKRRAQIVDIKKWLDTNIELLRICNALNIDISDENLTPDGDFYFDFTELLNEYKDRLLETYSRTRNYLTKKPFSTDKFKLNFHNSTLLDGWDISKETDNFGTIFLKDGKYYLGIMAKGHNKLFDYHIFPGDSEKIKQRKENTAKLALANTNEDYYEKMVYKLLPGPNKMLPKVVFSKKNIDFFAPDKTIMDIRNSASFSKNGTPQKGHEKADFNIKDCHKLIDFYKKCLKKHPEWSKYFNFEFSPTKEYTDISGFFAEIDKQSYQIRTERIKSDYIHEKIQSGELFLFQIYNKDFSQYSKGNKNLHTIYWEQLFTPENLQKPVFKLNGQAEVFFRASSIDPNDITHPKNQAIANKNPINNKTESVFAYDLIKDKRYSQDKLFFHVPITLNNLAENTTTKALNQQINAYVNHNKESVNIIGIDRGENHLLYYSVIDSNGKIIEQDSLNTIDNKAIDNKASDNKNLNRPFDYHDLLHNKQVERDQARKSWNEISQIKDFKAGYLSQVVHKLARLIEEHNAIIALEDLNTGFKRGRFKVEKQVYQKFEKALIEKLNFLVFKEKNSGEVGHPNTALQLTPKFETFKKMGKQTGIIYYLPAAYTSKIDPLTGFTKLCHFKANTIKEAHQLINNIDDIRYNAKQKYYEFDIDFKNFSKYPNSLGNKTKWTICSHGDLRYRFNHKTKQKMPTNVNQELMKLFENTKTNHEENLKAVLLQIQDLKTLKWFFVLLNTLMELRHSDPQNDDDFILSPVADKNAEFFDSRKYLHMENAPLPKDADANGAYNIALKCLLAVNERIGKKPEKPDLYISNKQWFDYIVKRNQ